MFSDVDSDQGSGFPQIGEGDDMAQSETATPVRDMEADFAADEELAKTLAFAADSSDEHGGSDKSMFLPLAEPTAGKSSSGGEASPMPGNTPTTCSSTIDETPASKNSTRHRIMNKRGVWASQTSEKGSRPCPMLFLNNPCYKMFKSLPVHGICKVRSRIRQKQCRSLKSMKNGAKVTLQDKTYSWPKDEVSIPSFMSEFVQSWLHDVAACSLAEPVDRGCAMDRLMALELENALTVTAKTVEGKVLKNKSVLLTYQGAWGILADLSPPPSTSVEDLVELVKNHKGSNLVFERFGKHFAALRDAKKIYQYVVSWEICTTTWQKFQVVRVHGHAWVNKGKSTSLALADVWWEKNKPYINESAYEFCGGRGSRSAAASFAGAFYLQVNKHGKVGEIASLVPFVGYQVKDYWITTLLSGRKISFGEAKKLYLQNVTRAEANIRQCDVVEKGLLDAQAAIDKELFELEIMKTEVEFISIPEIELWRKSYYVAQSRYRFAVLDGPSRTGKTRFAYSLSPPPREDMSSLSSKQELSPLARRKCIYYADCSGGLPDLRQFRRALHPILILDELHPKNAVMLKKIMQASNDDAVMGASPTMQHVYRINTYRTMIVVTTNTWAAGLQEVSVEDADWLKANSVYVHVPGPLWKQV